MNELLHSTKDSEQNSVYIGEFYTVKMKDNKICKNNFWRLGIELDTHNYKKVDSSRCTINPRYMDRENKYIKVIYNTYRPLK